MSRLFRLLPVIIILSAVNIAQAADQDIPAIKTTINRHRILVGDRIRYKAEISSRLDLEIEFPKFKDNKIGECEIKDSGKEIKRRFFGGNRIYINWLDLTSYYIGKRKIPPIEIKYREIRPSLRLANSANEVSEKGEGNWKALKTEELFLTVESVLPRNVRLYDIKDIKGPIYPFSFLKLAMWMIAAAIIVFVLIKLFKKLRKRKPPKTPSQIAIEELEAARAEFSRTGSVKDYYVGISDAVRRYIEVVFSLRAPEMTTQEFLATISGSMKLSAAYKDLLTGFMEACDLVKFAKHAPSRDEIESVFTTAKKFIEETANEYPPSQSINHRAGASADVALK